uniref:DNA damage-binding protein 2 n=1 Tax=Sus scrofa TaxID=9823 RepID=A0A8D1Z5C8_PIG
MPNEATSLSFWDVSAEKSLLSENEAENMCLFCLAGSSRRSDSGCLWAGLASLRVPAPCSSIIRALHHYKLGRTSWPSLQQGLQQSFLHTLASYRIFQKAAPFDRRATSLAWHPTHPRILAVGSKGGDILLWNFGIKDKPTFIKGIGAGGSITGLKFNPLNANQFFTSSMEGTTRLQDFKGNTLRVFASSGTCNIWFCSLDVSVRSRVVVTGDNVGHVILLNLDGKELWNLRMHKKKVTHVALNPCCDWFLATASVDQTVKIWDLRQVRGKSSFLYSLPHRHPVNAALFSPDGARLLTTDQKSEIRVYSASQWDCPPSLISHPHRHFQHLTPIKVSDGGKGAVIMGWVTSTQGWTKAANTEAFNPSSLPSLTQSSPLLSALYVPALQYYFAVFFMVL